MKKLQLIILCLVCAFSLCAATKPKTDPWIEWRRGYELFLEGDKYMRRNQLEEALSAYKRSRDTYKAVLEANTGWNQNLINSKISACETQILKIEKRLREAGKRVPSSSTATPATPAPSTQTVSPAPATSSGDDDGYKRKYFNLYIEVENLRKQLREQAQAARNIDVLLREKRLAEEKVVTLQRSIENLRLQIARPEQELQNLQKQLIAARLKNEQLVLARTTDTTTIQTLRNEIKTLSEELASLQKKLRESLDSKESLSETIEDLREKIEDLTSDQSDHDKEIKKYKDEIDALETTIDELKAEIKKLNSWIDEINKKKGDSDKVSASIVEENRNLKSEIEKLQAQIRKLEAASRDLQAKLYKKEQEYSTTAQTIATLTAQKKSLEKELKSARDLYISQLNADKLTKAELETLRAEQKKSAATLQAYITRNAELEAMLDTRDSTTRTYIQKLEALQKELDAKIARIKALEALIADSGSSSASAQRNISLNERIEKLERENSEFRRTIAALTADKDSLAAQLRSSQNELAVLRAPATSPTTAAAGSSSAGNSDYQKLLAAFNELKNKYDFLSAEIESLNKPLADVDDKEPEISSDKELAKFLLKAASDAAAANDYISAAWYFGELKKQSPKNELYIFGYALYSSVASDRKSASKIISELKKSREKYILQGVLAMLDGKKSEAEDNFEEAEDIDFISPEIKSLYAKNLPLIMNLFSKKGEMSDCLEDLKELLE